MDTKQYIASGILELYVLDLLESSADRLVVERYAEEYPEIKAEIFGIELALEAYAEANAKPLNQALLMPILANLKKQPNSNKPPNEEPPATKSPLTPAEKEIRSIYTNWVPWALTALAGLLALYLFFSGRSAQHSIDELESSNVELQQRYTTLVEDCDATRSALTASAQRNLILTNPATDAVILAGSDNAPDSRAIVFHNTELDQTIFRATELPTPPTGRQYQLWAIDEEGPKSLGVLATDLADDVLLDVDYIAGAATFAITLEETGGKVAPDLTQLQVIGNL